MNVEQARKLLGLDGTEDLKQIKTKYRRLMHEVHPDSIKKAADNDKATQINQAYQLVLKNLNEQIVISTEKEEKRKKQKPNWSGKENANAFRDRPIYHAVEGFDGEKIGIIEVARGKFVWSLDEEFSLFLKSVLDTSKDILFEIENELKVEPQEHIKQQYLAKLTYLLTSQFIDSRVSLSELAKVEDGTFKLDAMAELDMSYAIPKVGAALYPAGVSAHKLYLRNSSGQIVGYLSFTDDRLYYVVIPLFEQKRAQVKMLVVERKLKSRTKKKYVDLDLWIKLDDSVQTTAIESIELQIRELLAKYREEIV